MKTMDSRTTTSVVVALCLCLAALASAHEHAVLRGVKNNVGEEPTVRAPTTADKSGGEPGETIKVKNNGVIGEKDFVELQSFFLKWQSKVAELEMKRASASPDKAPAIDEEIAKLNHKRAEEYVDLLMKQVTVPPAEAPKIREEWVKKTEAQANEEPQTKKNNGAPGDNAHGDVVSSLDESDPELAEISRKRINASPAEAPKFDEEIDKLSSKRAKEFYGASGHNAIKS